MKGIQDNCVIFGLFASGPCSFEIYQGIDLLQHRGQEYCGIATFDHGVHQITHHGKVLNSFTDQDVDRLPANCGIGHVSLKERQPVKWHSLMGEIAVSFSGTVINADELIHEMMQQGTAFWRGYNVEILSRIVLEKKDTVAGLTALAEKIKGAYSLVILSREGIYATRDVYGFRPLILGQARGKYAVSSESRALQNLDFEVLRDVRPGEIILINEHGFNTLKQLPSPRRAQRS